ncbi:MAG: deoxyribodipyrimidine photo-lyase [Rhodothermaceae bacterium]|nr:deoxyribodipyrimidine photo-lyase [Rhodothermaceae bacterium]
MAATLVWFRNDLRLADHPALTRATERGEAVIPVFIWASEEEGDWPPGGAHRWWLHESLHALDTDLRSRSSRLILRSGPSLDTLRALIDATGAEAVYWNARHLPALHARDAEVRDALEADGIAVRTFASRILHHPDAVETTSGGPYHVFTPFWKKLRSQLEVAEPLPVPRLGERRAPASWPESASLDDFDLTPVEQDGVDWAEAMRAEWTPGEAGAQDRLEHFIEEALIEYPTERNRPDKRGSSMLSPYLHHGELGPRQVWHAVNAWVHNGAMREAADVFLSEIGWREFGYHMLHHYPDLPMEPLKAKFADFPWRDDAEALERWQRGQTGFPIVDAGMRQLWALGWMHNRVRMIVGSFLTKDLLLSWQNGARWFWDTLCDGDLASNTLNWQWVGGCGPDAQPFFRVFNPITQGEKFDPDGTYVRHWVPELTELPDAYLHKPWEAPAEVLTEAGVTLGSTYPEPLVDHAEARERALDAYQTVRSS